MDSARPNDRLFIAAFDGTRNSRYTDAPENHTNVARIATQIEARGDPNIASGYVEGVGTQGGVSGLADSIWGHTYEARLEEMYLKFVTQSKAWLDKDPNADIRILATGFSRGAEQVAGFTRLVEERGIQNPMSAEFTRDADGLIVGQVVYPQAPLRAPGTVIQSAGLFDPVGTGAPRQNDRRLAESVVSAFQITAESERRNLFQGTWITDSGMTPDGRFLNVGVAGAHSDIGGGYQRDGLAIRSGNLMTDYINGQIRPPPLEKRALPEDPGRYLVHRSEEHLFIYGTSVFDRAGARGMQDLLAPPALCRIDCRDAMPRNEAMAASLEWQRVEIGPVQGNMPIRSKGLEQSAFASDLLSAAARADGHAISERLRAQLASDAGQTWLQQGFEALERQSREFAARGGAHALAPAHEVDGPPL